jgi:hypothetical protein
MNRPIGVTLLAILDIVFGFLMVISGVAIVALAGVIEYYGSSGQIPGVPEMPLVWSLIAAFGGVISVVLLITAVIEFLIAWGLLGGKGWAWILTIVLTGISIALSIFSLPASMVVIAVDALIIYYFFRPHVKAFFGRGPAPIAQQPTAYQAPGTYQATPPPPAPAAAQQALTCPRCGKPLTYIEQYQRWYCYSCQQYA